MNRDRAILNPLRQSIQASRRKRRPAFETLEQRQMLAAAPIGVNDNYVLPNIGTLTVGNLAGSLAPSNIVEPFPEFTPSSVLAVTNGRMMGHPGMLALGNPASEYDAILVSDPRSNLTINQWLSVGQAGQAKLTVSRGGTLHTANWTEIGYGIGSAGNALITDPGTRWTNTNFLSIGDNGGRARFTLANGALLQNNNWTEIGNDAHTPRPSLPAQHALEQRPVFHRRLERRPRPVHTLRWRSVKYRKLGRDWIWWRIWPRQSFRRQHPLDQHEPLLGGGEWRPWRAEYHRWRKARRRAMPTSAMPPVHWARSRSAAPARAGLSRTPGGVVQRRRVGDHAYQRRRARRTRSDESIQRRPYSWRWTPAALGVLTTRAC